MEIENTGSTKNPLNNKEFLEHLSNTDFLLDHSIEECGNCLYRYILAQVAREMLEKGDIENDAIKRWEDESTKRWQKSKFYKLYIEEGKAGRDIKQAFEKRGWIM